MRSIEEVNSIPRLNISFAKTPTSFDTLEEAQAASSKTGNLSPDMQRLWLRAVVLQAQKPACAITTSRKRTVPYLARRASSTRTPSSERVASNEVLSLGNYAIQLL